MPNNLTPEQLAEGRRLLRRVWRDPEAVDALDAWMDEHLRGLFLTAESASRRLVLLADVEDWAAQKPHSPLCALVGGYRGAPCDCGKQRVLDAIRKELGE